MFLVALLQIELKRAKRVKPLRNPRIVKRLKNLRKEREAENLFNLKLPKRKVRTCKERSKLRRCRKK